MYAVAVPGGYPNYEALVASRPDAMHETVLGAVRALTLRASELRCSEVPP